MNKQQIGKAGELLVQYKLLKSGIESSPLTTDSGIDSVAFSTSLGKAFTIQVKSNEKPKPGGGKGALALDWWLRGDSPAELVALADLSSDSIWLFTHSEFEGVAQQKSSGRLHFYLYLSDEVNTKNRARMSEFKEYLIEKRSVPYSAFNNVVNADIACYAPFWVAAPLYTKKSPCTQCRLPRPLHS